MDSVNLDRLRKVSKKMGLKLVESNEEIIYSSKMLNISKPGRPEVKEILQKQLYSVVDNK